MICFELELNGERLVTAGLPGSAVLSADLTWVQRLDRAVPVAERSELCLLLGGLDSNDPTEGVNVDWVNKDLKVGDSVVIRVLDLPEADPPVARRSSLTGEQLKPDIARSNRYYLGVYKRQRVAIDRQIRVVENAIAAEKKTRNARPAKSRPTRRGKRR